MANNGKRRVVVTGMGVVTPVGNSLDTMWNNLITGKSGVGPNTLVPEGEMTCKIAGLCNDFKPEDYMPPRMATTSTTTVSSGSEIMQANILGSIK